ncbi:helix-turn-helix transcriptional regulator [Weizmannia acidilactici]|uniref:helix-turn-helix transcriptional regulator n=1 Tax=Weizmannia acidilactici TaxID=2607726 RepID=UPI00124BDB1A|nr:helix-turn-helix transcriptional regulator [Weizmannia acidilactici]GER75010.1 hypothetical protein BpPP18_30770 [Weizmannia acidilactici]
MRDWLKQLRKSKKLTQEQVASCSFIDRSYYSQIENGKRNPSPDVAINIAKVLDFNPLCFFKDELAFSNKIDGGAHLFKNDAFDYNIFCFFRDTEQIRLIFFYDKIEDYYIHVLAYLYAAIQKNRHCVIFDHQEYFSIYKKSLESLCDVEKAIKYTHYIDIKNIENPDILFHEINNKLRNLLTHLGNHEATISVWVHKDNTSQYVLGKRLQKLGINNMKTLFVQAYNAWSVSAGEHTKLMKEYPFLMTDGEIFSSPFYNGRKDY